MDHIYLHVPFCSGKCSYCSFYSVPYNRPTAERYVSALEIELGLVTTDSPTPSTIYIGGGTPAILEQDILDQLTSLITSNFPTQELAEWTIEANPGSVDADKLMILREAGVNRVSFGAQAFDDTTLEQLGRRHNAQDIVDSIETARSCGMDNVGLDLIANLPRTTPDDWRTTLEVAIQLEPEHISVYDLSVEGGTQLDKDLQAGKMTLATDDESIAKLDLAHKTLTDAGYGHYEISNYAKPGYECLHNMANWCGEDYLGFGPSASSRLATTRWTNEPDLEAYIAGRESGTTPPRSLDNLSPDKDLQERFLYNIRLLYGVSVADFCERFPPPDNSLVDHWNDVFRRLSNDGLVVFNDDRWRLTAKGRHMVDYVCRELLT